MFKRYLLYYLRQPSPRGTPTEVTLAYCFADIQPAVYITMANLSRGRDNSGERVALPQQVE